MRQLKDWFQSLSSRKRQAAVTILSVSALLALGYFLYLTKSSREEADTRTAFVGDVAMDSDLLEDTLTERVERRVEEAEQRSAQLEELLKQVNERLGEMEGAGAAPLPDIEDLSPKNELAELGAYPVAPSYPDPPLVEAPPAGLAQADLVPVETRIVGAISAMPAAQFTAPQKKSQTASIFLPPGFMNARLLTGVDALASQNATANPEPVIARVQAPAQLPNHVRANLQGCFVIGNATGSLAKERVEIQAVSLSCIDFQERAVIDEPIKGFFVDTDGKKGLSGKVVTRSGAILARAFVAGVVGGFGEAVQQTSGRQAISPLGSVQVFDTEDAIASGLGGGISRASEELQDLYLELARQAGPVIEVGAAKDVVLVIQEGVDLNIRRDVNVAQ